MQLNIQPANPVERCPNLFQQDVASAKGYLLRYARQHLRNDAWAEDAVAETILAALEKPQSFHGKSSLNTWLVAILKFKIIDCLRANARETTILESEAQTEPWDDSASAFAQTSPSAAEQSACAELDFQNAQFLTLLERHLHDLPPTMSRVFVLRECLDYSTDEICDELKLTQSNVWVLLHRAKLRLRDALIESWCDGCAPFASAH